METEKGRCVDCRWFESTGEKSVCTELPDGWCYRMPHTEPKTNFAWCGEFEKKEKK